MSQRIDNPGGHFVESFSDCPNGKRSIRPISVCRRLHDDSVAILSKYWDDDGINACNGVPLPFVSYGGSHTVAFAIMVGIVQNVHMRRFR